MSTPPDPARTEPRATAEQLDEAYRQGTRATLAALAVSALALMSLYAVAAPPGFDSTMHERGGGPRLRRL